MNELRKTIVTTIRSIALSKFAEVHLVSLPFTLPPLSLSRNQTVNKIPKYILWFFVGKNKFSSKIYLQNVPVSLSCIINSQTK